MLLIWFALRAMCASPSPSAVAADSLPSLVNVRVLRAYNLRAEQRKRPDSSAGIGDVIVIQVRDLRSLANYVNCKSNDGEEVAGCEKQSIALYLADREMPGVTPKAITAASDKGNLQFHLVRTAESDEVWADLLGAPPLRRLWDQSVKISVGPAGGHAVPTAVADFHLIRMHPGWFWAFVVGLLVILSIAIRRWPQVSDLLRDAGPAPVALDGKARPRAFSLARFQMAVWFVAVIGSFFFIWLVTQNLDTITASVLGLIGIGAATALGAAAVDANKRQDSSKSLADAIAEKTAIDTEIAGLAGQQLQQKQARQQTLSAQIADLSKGEDMQPSEGFLNDLLTDEDRKYSLHRFQMFVWTVVLLFIFVNQVWNRLSMPEFSDTLLALMGISSGTYLGFKIPEKAP